MATEAIDPTTNRPTASPVGYANLDATQPTGSSALPLQVQLGNKTFAGTNDHGRVSLANTNDRTQWLSFKLSPNGTVNPRSIQANNLGPNQTAALVRGAGGSAATTTPQQGLSRRLDTLQTNLDRLQNQVNGFDPSASDSSNTLQQLSDQVAKLGAALQSLQSKGSQASPATQSQWKSLMDEVAKLVKSIADMVTQMGGTPVSANGATTSTPSAQDTSAPSSGSTQPQPKENTLGKIVDVASAVIPGASIFKGIASIFS